ncbi:hypothetical protein GEMRC1_000902 [Eukaryota sp. GEM-RC1]
MDQLYNKEDILDFMNSDKVVDKLDINIQYFEQPMDLTPLNGKVKYLIIGRYTLNNNFNKTLSGLKVDRLRIVIADFLGSELILPDTNRVRLTIEGKYNLINVPKILHVGDIRGITLGNLPETLILDHVYNLNEIPSGIENVFVRNINDKPALVNPPIKFKFNDREKEYILFKRDDQNIYIEVNRI